MSESEKEHFRIGAAQAYSDKVGDLAITDKELRQISQKDELAKRAAGSAAYFQD